MATENNRVTLNMMFFIKLSILTFTVLSYLAKTAFSPCSHFICINYGKNQCLNDPDFSACLRRQVFSENWAWMRMIPSFNSWSSHLFTQKNALSTYNARNQYIGLCDQCGSQIRLRVYSPSDQGKHCSSFISKFIINEMKQNLRIPPISKQ